MKIFKTCGPTLAAMRVLGIDPGYDRLGIALVEGDPSHPTLITSACITPPQGELSARLGFVATALSELVSTYSPTHLGLETLFFSVNRKTAIAVAEARGVALSVAGTHHLPVIECSPQQVKVAVTGYGGASKASVASMIPRLLSLPPKKRLDDEIDAIAIALTALAFGKRRG